MASTILTQDTVFALLNSKEEFPVNFEDAWQWCEFATKGSAKRSFERVGFELGVDYTLNIRVKRVKGNQGGGSTQYEEIYMTVDCLKAWGMTLNNEKGKEIRRYFLKCEATLKEILKQTPQPQHDIERLEERLRLKGEVRLALTNVCKEWMEYHGWYYNRPRVGIYFASLMDSINIAITTETSQAMQKRLSQQLGRKVKSDELIRDWFPVESLRLYLSVHTVLTNTLFDFTCERSQCRYLSEQSNQLGITRKFYAI